MTKKLIKKVVFVSGGYLQIAAKPPKPETYDKEIEDIARQIRETNEKKMVQLKCVPAALQAGQYPAAAPTPVLSEDWTSVQGQFGWAELANNIIPYITRGGDKYVSLRMADSKILMKYRQLFTDEIRTCFEVPKIPVTRAEAQLLNEINFRHCDNFFGRLEFTTNDYIIPLKDISEMYEFLNFCYITLIEKNSGPHKICGFIRISSQNCVPYICHQSKQYVPLFYFEGECKYLEERSVELQGWPLAYLKLSCKIQGIRKTLIDGDTMRVVEVELVKKFFPPDTLFEDTWLSQCNIESLVQKPVPKLVPMQTDTRQISTNLNKNVDLSRNRHYEKRSPAKQMQTKAVLQKVPTIRPAEPAVASNNLPYHTPAIRSVPYATNNSQVSDNTYLNQFNKYINNSIPETVANFAPVVPNNHTPIYQRNTTSFNKPSYVTSNGSGNAQHKQIPLLRPVSTQNRSKLFQIPDFVCDMDGCPYFLVRTQVDEKFFNSCINMEPYMTTTLLVTLEETASAYFGVSIDKLTCTVNAMNIDTFLPNKLQIRALDRAKRYPTRGMIKLKDFVDRLPHIRYLIKL